MLHRLLIPRPELPREQSSSYDHAAQRGIQRVDIFSDPPDDEVPPLPPPTDVSNEERAFLA